MGDYHTINIPFETIKSSFVNSFISAIPHLVGFSDTSNKILGIFAILPVYLINKSPLFRAQIAPIVRISVRRLPCSSTIKSECQG